MGSQHCKKKKKKPRSRSSSHCRFSNGSKTSAQTVPLFRSFLLSFFLSFIFFEMLAGISVIARPRWKCRVPSVLTASTFFFSFIGMCWRVPFVQLSRAQRTFIKEAAIMFPPRLRFYYICVGPLKEILLHFTLSFIYKDTAHLC